MYTRLLGITSPAEADNVVCKYDTQDRSEKRERKSPLQSPSSLLQSKKWAEGIKKKAGKKDKVWC
jgi:hypothetical protein